MDSTEALVGARIDWVSDKLSPRECKPRHIGRVVTFEYFLSEDPDIYDSVQVIGTLESFVGNDALVSGEIYDYGNMKNPKIWRAKLA